MLTRSRGQDLLTLLPDADRMLNDPISAPFAQLVTDLRRALDKTALRNGGERSESHLQTDGYILAS